MSAKTKLTAFLIGSLFLTSFKIAAQAVCPVNNQTVSPATATAVCNGAFNFSLNTQAGVNYYVRNSANVVLSGPYAGTGGVISLPSGNIITTSTLNVFGKAQSGALTFDGVNDYVNISYNSNLNFGTSTDITIEAMVKFTANQPNYTGIVTQSASASPFFQFVLYGNKIAVEMINASGTMLATGTSTLNDGKWHHVAMVATRSTGNLKLYVDGLVEANVTNTTVSGNFNTSNGMFIGCDRTQTIYFTGSIDEVRIWNLAKTPAQLYTASTTCLVGNEAGLIAYYTFENGTGSSTLTDIAGSDNNGTLTNMSTATAWTYGVDNCGACSTMMGVKPVITINQLTNQTVSVGTASFCVSGSTSVTAAGSELNANYYLANSTNTTVQGPLAGTGGSLNFSTGTLTNTTTFSVSARRLSGALNFDGVDDMIAITETSALAQFSTTPMTMEAWVYPTNVSLSRSVIRKEGAYALYLNNGRIYFEMYRDLGGGTNYTITLGQPILPTNQWSHIAAVWQGGIYADIYLNGVLQVIGGGSSTNNNVSGLTIGRATIANQPFAGKLDEIRIWNTARTATQLRDNMRACLTGTESGLLLYYKLDESGTAIIDAAGGDNNGVLLNANQSSIYTDGMDNCGCKLQMALTPTVYTYAYPTITATSPTICTGNNAIITPTGAGVGGTYTITGGSFTVNPGANTSYSITGANAAGCPATNTAVANVAVNTTPTISVNSATICSGNSVALVPSGMTGGSYTITGGTYTVAPNTTSSYSVTGKDGNNCVASNIAVATVSVNASPTLGVNSATICAGNSATISPSGNTGGTYSITGGNFIVSPGSTTSYSVSGTSGAGCASSNTVVSSVSVNTLPVVSVNSGSICAGQSFIINASGANTYTYSSGSNNVSPATNTNYSVTGTSSAGCISSGAAVSSVTVNALPIVSVNSGSICAGESFTITASGANTYTYTGGSTIVSPSTNTGYSVTGTSSEGCASSNTAVSSVTVNSLPTVSVNSGSICAGQSFSINASGASTYTYSSGSNVVSPVTNTNYSVTGTSSAGCVGSAIAVSTVVVNAPPTVSVNSGSICSGQSFVIIASGANSYTYTGGSNTVSPLANTDYSVTGTSTAGCVSSNAAVSSVSVNTTPTVSVNSGSICAGQSFTLMASGANTYTYTGGNTIVSPSSNTGYSVTGTSAAGCISSNTAVSTVSVNTLPTISVNSGSICAGQSFSITASGASTYTYSSGSNIVSPVANTNYSVTGTSSAGCLGSNTAVSSVTVNASPTVSVNSGSICSGQSFIILASGANSYTYTGGSNTVSPLTNTDYSVTGTSTAGCVSSNAAVSSVSVNTSPTVSVNSGVICSGESFTIAASGADSYTYTSGSNVVTPSSTTSYSVTGASNAGCVSFNTAVSTVTVNTTPTVSVNSGSICLGQTFVILAGGADTYSYSSGSNSVSPVSNTTYSVIGTNTAGCLGTSIAISTVIVNANPTITVNSGTLCSGNNFTILPTGAITYTYSNGSATVSPTGNTSYSVTGADANGCLSQVAVSSVTVEALPQITASVSVGTICTGEAAIISASGAVTYTWSTSENTSSITVSPVTSTSYTLKGSSGAGCVNSAMVEVSVDACTGIASNAASKLNLSVYPNPNKGEVIIETSNETLITVTDMVGQLVYSTHLNAGLNKISIHDLSNGIYFINARNGKALETIKIIKQ